MKEIQNIDQMNDFLSQQGDQSYWIFKHSATCPTSRRAFMELKSYLDSSQGSGFPVVLIVVQEARDVSNAVAEKFGVQHQSPQILLVKGNEVVWHASHGNITAQQLGKVTLEQLA